MRTRHTEFSIDEDSRDSIDVAGIVTRRSTRSRPEAIASSSRVIRRPMRHTMGRYMSPRLELTRSKRKKYRGYPDIEYAAAKRTKQNSTTSNPEVKEELPVLAVPRRTHSQEITSCSPRRTRKRAKRRLPAALSRLKRDLGTDYEEVIRIAREDKPYGLRRERQIVMRYEAPDFREVVHHRMTTDDEDEDEEEEDEDEEGEEDEEEEEEEEGADMDDSLRAGKYSLRRKPPKVVRYEDVSLHEPSKTRGMYGSYRLDSGYHPRYPVRTSRGGGGVRRSRPKAPGRQFRGRHQSTTSESETESEKEDEVKFEKRKKKSMNQARARCLPMNLTIEDLQKGLFRERQKAGASMADIDPMSLNKSTTFSSIGGLDEHVQSLREMVVFPMLYPEVFDRFNVAPPRGVIFYGSPGTGKTLVARALANECSKEDQKISFFMRKGADCLSKWVGESERQLRLLFDQAYAMRPSIIFFDEIDGLAPVRSTRQEQIHSSIVSTLLALMDGLDSRGEVVVIGATNRLDAIDPALRRPGRFDREFHFPLPSAKARSEILRIHTDKWSPQPHADLLSVLADRTAGFCGADLKALVTESALGALRRRYPQIYKTNKRLLLDPASITVHAQDFYQALVKIKPAQTRSSDSTRLPLPQHLRPLLSDSVMDIVNFVTSVLPASKPNTANLDTTSAMMSLNTGNDFTHSYAPKKKPTSKGSTPDQTTSELILGEPEIYKGVTSRNTSYNDIDSFFSTLESYFSKAPSHRPRVLLTSHCSLVLNSLLHVFEGVSVHELSLATLHDPNYRCTEEAAAKIISEASKRAPSIIYLPNLNLLECSVNVAVSHVIVTLLADIAPQNAVMVLATMSHSSALDQGSVFKELFGPGEIMDITKPSVDSIVRFFTPLLTTELTRSFDSRKESTPEEEELEEAPPVQPKPLTSAEVHAIEKREAATLRELRLFLRDIVNKIMKERKFYCFCKPVNLEEVQDYLEVVRKPMDLERVRENIDRMVYNTVKDFISDVELVAENAIEYNPPDDHTGRQIRHRAAELKDFLHSLLDSELDEDFAKLCEEMKTAREARRRTEDSASDPATTRPRSASRNTGGVALRRGNSYESEDEGMENGVSSDSAQEIWSEDATIDKIVQAVKGRKVDTIIHLYTLIHQEVIKQRPDRGITRQDLIEKFIDPVIASFL